MKKINLHLIESSVKDLLLQLPFPVAYVLLGVFAAMMAVEQYDSFFSVLWMLCLPSMLLSLAASLVAKAYGWNTVKRLCAQLLPVAVLLAYAVILPAAAQDFKLHDGMLYALLLLASALILTFAPLIGSKDALRLWTYNHSLLSRLFIAAVFAGFLYAGIALATVGIQELFGLHVHDNVYLYLYVLVAGLFGANFFLAGFTNQGRSGAEEFRYPKVVKIFTLYILYPLVLAYMLILYAYAIRICIAWELPRGWASSLVLVLAGLGMLAYAAGWPLAQSKSSALANAYHRYFFPLFAPLLLLLFVAAGRRIADYGVTEMRYLLVAVALWLTFVVAYFMLSKKKELRLIPMTLAAIAIIASFGPLSAFSVSQRSQTARLESILRQNNILQNGVIGNVATSDSVAYSVNAILRYLEDSKAGLEPLETRWGVAFARDTASGKLTQKEVAAALHLSTLSTYDNLSDFEKSENFYWGQDAANKPIDAFGYRYVFPPKNLSEHADSLQFLVEGKSYMVVLADSAKAINVLRDGRLLAQKTVAEYMREKQQQGWVVEPGRRRAADNASGKADLNFSLDLEGCKLKFVVLAFTGDASEAENVRLESMSFSLLVQEKAR